MILDREEGVLKVKLNSTGKFNLKSFFTNKEDSEPSQDVILILTDYGDFTQEAVSFMEEASKLFVNIPYSFVVVANPNQYKKENPLLNIVPTEVEAYDIIEMERIERDLGF